MAPSSRGLVLVLTIWVVAWPAASIRTGSPDSGWWGTQEAQALRQAARTPTRTGDFAESERIFYRRSADLAVAYLQAKGQAEQARDPASLQLGRLDADASSIPLFRTAGLSRALDFEGKTRSKLPAEEAESLRPGTRTSTTSESLKMKLTEMDEYAGMGSTLTIAESFPSEDSLNHFRQRLRGFEVALSFGLEDKEFFLWAVTRKTLHVYWLPLAHQIPSTLREFREAIEAGTTAGRTSADAEDIGGSLYTMLFGQLHAQEASKPAWLLSPEDALQVLPQGRNRGRRVFLAERYSLQLIARALPPAGPSSGFLSVGDPIDNFADLLRKSVVPGAGLAALVRAWTVAGAPASWAPYQVFGHQSLESIGPGLGSRSYTP